MRVLIGTPAGGGAVSTQYLYSFVTMLGPCVKHGITPVLFTLSQESLLPRARNHIAHVALRDKYDKVFFIDADTGWTPEQFLRICMSPFPVVAGQVPLKTHPIVMNYMPFKDDEKYFHNGLRTPESSLRMRKGHGAAEIPVAFTGTAFLCIDTTVLYHLAKDEETYQYPDPYTGEQRTHWDFFGAKPIKGTYYSEDWVFCHKVREAGYDVRVNFDVFCNHVGAHVFQVNPNVPVDQAPEVYRPLLYRLSKMNPEQVGQMEDKAKSLVPDEIKEQTARAMEGMTVDATADTQQTKST